MLTKIKCRQIKQKALPGLAGMVLLFIFACDVSGLVYWSNSSGSADSFTYSAGGSDNGLFGDPNVSGDKLVFTPESFSASASNGNAAIIDDRIEVVISAKPGKTITKVKITESGEYSINTVGLASVSGTMFLTNLNQYEVVNDDLSAVPQVPISSGSGDWAGQVTIDNLEWTKFRLVIDNNLLLTSGQSSENYIEKNSFTIEIPEPATAILLAVGLSMFYNKRLNV